MGEKRITECRCEWCELCSPPPPLSISAGCQSSVERNRIGLTAHRAEEHRGLEETYHDTTVLSPSGQVALIYDKMKCLEMDPKSSKLIQFASLFHGEPMVLGQKWIQIVVFLVSFAYRLTTSCLLAAGFPNQGNLPAAKKRSMPSTANSSTPDSVVAPLPGRSIEHFSHIKPCKGLRLAKKTSRNDGNPVLQTEN